MTWLAIFTQLTFVKLFPLIEKFFVRQTHKRPPSTKKKKSKPSKLCTKHGKKIVFSNFPVPKIVSITMYFPSNMRMIKVSFIVHYIVHFLKKVFCNNMQNKKLSSWKSHYFYIYICHYLFQFFRWCLLEKFYNLNLINFIINLRKIFTIFVKFSVKIISIFMLNILNIILRSMEIVKKNRHVYKFLKSSVVAF